MARRGSRVKLGEKLAINEKTLAGESDPDIAKELERSVHTVRKWSGGLPNRVVLDWKAEWGVQPAAFWAVTGKS